MCIDRRQQEMLASNSVMNVRLQYVAERFNPVPDDDLHGVL